MPCSAQLYPLEKYTIDSPILPVWLNPEWMEAVARTQDLTPYYLVLSSDSGKGAVFPIYERKRALFRQTIAPILGYYQPLLYHLPERKYPNRKMLDQLELVRGLAEFIHKTYSSIRINLHPDLYDVRGFTQSGLKAFPLYTFRHNLDNELLLFSEEKTNLRKAEKRIYEGNYHFDPEKLIALTLAMYDRKEMIFKLSHKKFISFLESMHAQGLIRQYCLFRQGKIVSSNLLLCDNSDTVYTIIRASEPEELKHGISVLHSKLVVETLRKEFQVIDWCGANSPGPSRFKASLGFQLQVFYQIKR